LNINLLNQIELSKENNLTTSKINYFQNIFLYLTLNQNAFIKSLIILKKINNKYAKTKTDTYVLKLLKIEVLTNKNDEQYKINAISLYRTFFKIIKNK